MRGGVRPGAGRKKGQKSASTREREQAMKNMAATLDGVLPNAFKGNAHALLMAVYKNEDLALDVRIDAAKAAIGFEIPKLAAVEHSGNAENPLQVVHDVLGALDGASRGLPTGIDDEGEDDASTARLAS